MLKTELTARLGRESVARLLVQFSVPAVMGLVANALYNIVDRIFIGHFVDAPAGNSIGLGAVSVVYPISVLIIAIGTLMGVGAASQFSRYLGIGHNKRAERVLGNVLLSVIVSSVFVLMFGNLFLNDIIMLCGASTQLAGVAYEYMQIVLFGIPFQLFVMVMCYLIRAEGFPRQAMGAIVIGAVGNIVLDWLFLAQFGWGVKGAALATSLAQLLSAGYAAYFYVFKVGLFRIRLENLRPDREILKEMLYIGVSPCILELFFAFSMLLFNNTLQRLGGDVAISAMGIFFSLDNLIFLPVMGIAEGLQPIVGYNYGAGKLERVRKTIILACWASIAFFSVSFAITQVSARYMIMLFNSNDAALIDLTTRAMRIGYMGMPIAGIAIVAGSAFQSLGKAGYSLFLNVCRNGLFLVPSLLILPDLFGIDGVWATFMVVDAAGGILGGLMLWKYRNSIGEISVEKLEIPGAEVI